VKAYLRDVKVWLTTAYTLSDALLTILLGGLIYVVTCLMFLF
jgi:hypothetical protein